MLRVGASITNCLQSTQARKSTSSLALSKSFLCSFGFNVNKKSNPQNFSSFSFKRANTSSFIKPNTTERKFSSSVETSSQNEVPTLEVVNAGMYTLVQDYPGRIGLWRVGVPPSGPMDHFAFRVANRLVGNEEGVAALELTYLGPTLTFSHDTLFALTGAKMVAKLDDAQVPYWETVFAKAGSTLTIEHIEGDGARTYLAVAGGIQAPEFLGSKSTFPLGGMGGPQHPNGREVKNGDKLKLGKAENLELRHKLPEELIPKYSNEWEILSLPGPQEAPDYFTEEDVKMFYSTNWEISHNASRLGVRMNGPRPKFTRPDGGEGGSHPSNLHDNAYAIGAINFTGDHPVALMVDGPSLGGFVCPTAVPTSEIWKFGQVKPSDTVKFKKITLEEALKNNYDMDQVISTLQPFVAASTSTYSLSTSAKSPGIGSNAILKVVEATASTPRIEYRMAGDKHILVEYGPLILDINLRVRIHLLEEWLRTRKIAGITDTTPGVRSLLIQYDYKKLGLQDLLNVLDSAEKEIPNPLTQKIKSRVFNLPLAFNDKWTRAAIEKYISTIRSEAPYLPDNIEFIAKNNGLSSGEEVKKMVFDTSYLVAGLGDVYLGAPCAFPVDPRQRLVVPKYNPARTFTPEGAVGIGGTYMCIYPIESPGGYQLIGRTLPIWNSRGNFYPFSPEKPWMLDMFDQVRYYPVTEEELEKQRDAFSKGDLKLDISDEVFDVENYNTFLKSIQGEVATLKERQKTAQAIQLQRDIEILAKLKNIEDSSHKIVNYLASMVVNGPNHPGAVGPPPSKMDPIIPQRSNKYPSGDPRSSHPPPKGWKQVLQEKGPAGFAKEVRKHKGLLVTDTTWRDAHQSLLATRIRTYDMAMIAPSTTHVLSNCYSIECWGGATFDVALRFLHEDPWERLAKLRELVPNIPFQMLLRGANALGYSNYPDNVIYDFCKKSVQTGMDVFRVFDSLNYLENLRLGIDAVGAAGGVIEAVVCYTGDLTDPKKSKYNLEYYVNMARELVKHGIHVLCIKDMAGLLKPRAATLLISTLRREFPDLPIHIHTHDTGATGVASMIACYEAGADVVDCCSDALSGLTSQPSMGAIVGNYANSEHHTGIELENLQYLTTYWEGVRRLYAPFESGQKSAGHDVYLHEIPGGQYTNMLFQALSLGLASEWDAIKVAYHQANNLLGNIVKVTPSSKVVGDLAQFMVANKLDEKTCLEKAGELDFPTSVIEFLQGYLGHPPGGFPEPFSSRVLKGRPVVQGRAGASLPPHDLEGHKVTLQKKFPEVTITDLDVQSSTQFPQVFEDYIKHYIKYGNVTNLPTREFLAPMQIGDEVTFTEQGRKFHVKLTSVKDYNASTQSIPVEYEINGKTYTVFIKTKPETVPFIKRDHSGKAKGSTTVAATKEKADKNHVGSIGATMPGKVVDIKVKVGDVVTKGTSIVVLSAMKMETIVRAPKDGKVSRIVVKQDDNVSAGDLLLEID